MFFDLGLTNVAATLVPPTAYSAVTTLWNRLRSPAGEPLVDDIATVFGLMTAGLLGAQTRFSFVDKRFLFPIQEGASIQQLSPLFASATGNAGDAFIQGVTRMWNGESREDLNIATSAVHEFRLYFPPEQIEAEQRKKIVFILLYAWKGLEYAKMPYVNKNEERAITTVSSLNGAQGSINAYIIEYGGTPFINKISSAFPSSSESVPNKAETAIDPYQQKSRKISSASSQSASSQPSVESASTASKLVSLPSDSFDSDPLDSNSLDSNSPQEPENSPSEAISAASTSEKSKSCAPSQEKSTPNDSDSDSEFKETTTETALVPQNLRNKDVSDDEAIVDLATVEAAKREAPESKVVNAARRELLEKVWIWKSIDNLLAWGRNIEQLRATEKPFEKSISAAVITIQEILKNNAKETEKLSRETSKTISRRS